MAMLDLVVAVDTSVAHLAGAMGKAVALLIPFSPDWRWLLDRTDSPWYPTMRIFRQPGSATGTGRSSGCATNWPMSPAAVRADLNGLKLAADRERLAVSGMRRRCPARRAIDLRRRSCAQGRPTAGARCLPTPRASSPARSGFSAIQRGTPPARAPAPRNASVPTAGQILHSPSIARRERRAGRASSDWLPTNLRGIRHFAGERTNAVSCSIRPDKFSDQRRDVDRPVRFGGAS